MKYVFLFCANLSLLHSIGQTSEEDGHFWPRTITVVETDTLIGEYLEHLPINGKFEQLELYRYPNGKKTYRTSITGSFQDGKPNGTWDYYQVNKRLFYTAWTSKSKYFYEDSTVYILDHGRKIIAYNKDSTSISVKSLRGNYNWVQINCSCGFCHFQAIDRKDYQFCFHQEKLDKVIQNIEMETPIISIYYEYGLKDCP